LLLERLRTVEDQTGQLLVLAIVQCPYSNMVTWYSQSIPEPVCWYQCKQKSNKKQHLPQDSRKVMIKVLAKFTQERKYDLKVANPSLSRCSNSSGLFLTYLSRRAALNNPHKLEKWHETRTYEILSTELLAFVSLIFL